MKVRNLPAFVCNLARNYIWNKGSRPRVKFQLVRLMWLKAAFVAVKLDGELKPREIENQDPNQPEHQQQNKLTTVSKPSRSDRPIDMFTSEWTYPQLELHQTQLIQLNPNALSPVPIRNNHLLLLHWTFCFLFFADDPNVHMSRWCKSDSDKLWKWICSWVVEIEPSHIK